MNKTNTTSKIVFITGLIFICNAIFAQQADNPVVWYRFNEINIDKENHIKTIENSASNGVDTISGHYVALKDGINQNSLLLDGYSAYFSNSSFPELKDAFSIEAYIAAGAYPTNYCPIAEQKSEKNKGFSLGINHVGKAYLEIATADGWVRVESMEKLPLLNWTHVCGIYDQNNIKLYINGVNVAEKLVPSPFIPAKGEKFYCGVTSEKTVPEGSINLKGTHPVYHYFDGLIDELKIWNKNLTVSYLNDVKAVLSKQDEPALPVRNLPELPSGNKFGAQYVDLKYYESWDNFWRIAKLPDVVVSFDELNGSFVFWRGTSYIPHWVTENGIWYTDEFNETWGEGGCYEPMSDKRCEHSHVRIIESSPARCIVHWRYSLIDSKYRQANKDSITGWGDWSDEFYTIYPDGTAVRSQTLHSNNLSSPFEWHEGIIVMGQEQYPEEVLHTEALIMANMQGKEHIYSWEPVGKDIKAKDTTFIINKEDKWLTELPGANIQIINTRSSLKPFTIINPADEPEWDLFNHLFRREYSIFPWWNHWPTALTPSDGRYAWDKDRASHSSLTHVRNWKSYKKDEFSETRLMLVGLTEESASGLIPLAKFWTNPPKILAGENTSNLGFNPEEKAYHIELINPGVSDLSFSIKATSEIPSIRPAFVVSNWNGEAPVLKINGEVLPENEYKYGFAQNQLIIWIDKIFESQVDISFGNL